MGGKVVRPLPLLREVDMMRESGVGEESGLWCHTLRLASCVMMRAHARTRRVSTQRCAVNIQMMYDVHLLSFSFLSFLCLLLTSLPPS